MKSLNCILAQKDLGEGHASRQPQRRCRALMGDYGALGATCKRIGRGSGTAGVETTLIWAISCIPRIDARDTDGERRNTAVVILVVALPNLSGALPKAGDLWLGGESGTAIWIDGTRWRRRSDTGAVSHRSSCKNVSKEVVIGNARTRGEKRQDGWPSLALLICASARRTFAVRQVKQKHPQFVSRIVH